MVSAFNDSTLTVIKGSIPATVDSLDNMGVDSAIERVLRFYDVVRRFVIGEVVSGSATDPERTDYSGEYSLTAIMNAR